MHIKGRLFHLIFNVEIRQKPIVLKDIKSDLEDKKLTVLTSI